MIKETLSEVGALKTLFSEGPDHLVLAETLAFIADRLMLLGADPFCGASKHEHTAERTNHRNGYRARGGPGFWTILATG